MQRWKVSNSEKFRELLEREKYLQNQLNDCETAQHRMLKKAFKNLGLEVRCFGEMVDDRADIAIAKITDWSVEYCRYSGIFCETYEISFEDLFDAEEE